MVKDAIHIGITGGASTAEETITKCKPDWKKLTKKELI